MKFGENPEKSRFRGFSFKLEFEFLTFKPSLKWENV
jgi:hypothetical protein